jgi:hypothetical protein
MFHFNDWTMTRKTGAWPKTSPSSFLIFVPIRSFFFWSGERDWSLNPGLSTYEAGTQLLKPHLQCILLWLFWRWGSYKLFAWAGLLCDLHISDSRVARITGVSHWCRAWSLLIKTLIILYSNYILLHKGRNCPSCILLFL